MPVINGVWNLFYKDTLCESWQQLLDMAEVDKYVNISTTQNCFLVFGFLVVK